MPKNKQNLKILIVDDIPNVCTAIKETLISEGYHNIITSFSGKEALSQYLDLKPDLVILDINLPGEDSLEICRQIKKNELPPKIILMSVFTALVDPVQAKKAGADSTIIKDTGYSYLKEALENIMKE